MADQSEATDAAIETKEPETTKLDEEAEEAERERLRREREARAQALTLEIVGDLPFAEVKPPENVLFVCKLNPVTEDEDLHTIFSRFGPIVSCEVIRDKRTKESLQYAFIEFENQKDSEQAYFKMSGVLIDDHRIHVDFSQSVSRLADVWRTKTNNKRRQHGGGFGGVAELEKKRQYRKMEAEKSHHNGKHGYDMVFDKDDASDSHQIKHGVPGKRSRSRSPEFHDTGQSQRPAPRSRSRERRPDHRDKHRDQQGRWSEEHRSSRYEPRHDVESHGGRKHRGYERPRDRSRGHDNDYYERRHGRR